MFSSTLRRHSPSIARISFSSIRSLTSYTPTRTVVRNSLKNPPTAPFLRHRFFSASPFLKNDTEAEQAFAEELTVDSDPPAGEYIHRTGDPEVTHHYGEDEPITRFQQLADRGLVDPVIIEKIVKEKGYEEMTKVQRKTILETLGGEDVFGQAKTGTGKTFAFLLPVIQRIRTTTIPFKPRIKINFRAPRQGETNADVRAIIISPTRELAQQIEVDAQFLTQGTGIITQLAVGGSGKRESLGSIRGKGCHILVATPGRLHDILSDRQADISTENLETLVLDEADHLLDQGFAEAIDDIIKLLPSRDAPVGNTGKPRQTLLFSATIPDKVLNMAKKTMRRGHKFLQMVEKGEAATHEKVQQNLIRCRGLENQLPALVELLKREIEAVANSEGTENTLQPFKAIIFFTAVRPVMLFSAALRNLNRGHGEGGSMRPFHPAGIYEIHSRLTQAGRTRAAENFRRVKSGILISSDVTARGMDFPGVTHVIQMGAPKSIETYIHRIGRTARGDKTGEGYLFLSEMEYPDAMRELRKLPLKPNDSLVTAGIDLGAEQELPKHASEILASVSEANQKIDPFEMKNTYLSLIGCYGHIQKPLLANSLNRLATLGWGLPSPPEVSRVLASKLGIETHHGFHVSTSSRNEANSEESDRPSYGGRGGRGGRGGFGGRGSRGGRGGFGDRPPYRSSGGEEEGGYERKSFRPRDDNNGGSYERKPYRPRENGDGEGDSSYERKPFRPRDDNNGSSYERKPFRPRDDSSGGYERKPFRPRNDDDGEGGSGGYERKPYRSRSDDDGEGGSGGYERKSFAPRGRGGFRGRGRGRGGSDWGSGSERGRGGYQRARGPGTWERGNRGRSGGRGRS